MSKLLSRFCVILGAFSGLMLSLSAVTAGGSGVAQTAKKTINIGIYAPYTTKSAYLGRNILGAMEIAREQINSSEINYEFYTLDAQTNKENTLQKFIDAYHINVILTEGSTTGRVVASVAAKNKLIHFCLGCDSVVADGTNNFQAHSPNHQRGAVLAKTMKPEFVAQFKQEYFSHPVTEAGYAYDVFHLLNNSAVIAMKTNSTFSSPAIATHLLALEPGIGLMGTYSMNKKGVTYKKETLTA